MNKTHDMNPARKMAVSAMMAALSTVGIVLGGVMPTLQLSLYAALSAMPAILAAEGAVLHGLLVATAASLLGFFLSPDKLGLLPYVMFFGWYGVVFVVLPTRMTFWPAFFVKLGIFNVVLAAGLVVFHVLLVPLEFPWWVWVLAGQPIFLLYDWVMGQFMGFYGRRLRRLVVGEGR